MGKAAGKEEEEETEKRRRRWMMGAMIGTTNWQQPKQQQGHVWQKQGHVVNNDLTTFCSQIFDMLLMKMVKVNSITVRLTSCGMLLIPSSSSSS